MKIQEGFYKRFKEDQMVDGFVAAGISFNEPRGSVTVTFHLADRSCTAVLSAEEARILALELLRQEDKLNQCEFKMLTNRVLQLGGTTELKP